ncbi:glycosyltransferase 87 family protein [Terrabacter sp. Root85]|uniref:glycosyltransferase 87 family protein n=1 Tax=Terrabacter sp. Root85 TaxID=1736603 RepID=UPI0012FB4341|nr:glycosyltransferase 87 family protein [Terrabacter sp. Root85]
MSNQKWRICMAAQGTPIAAKRRLRPPPGSGVVVGWMVVGAALYVRWSASATWNFVDLTDFYYGGVSVLEGVDVYAPRPGVLAFNYPPFAAVAFVPLGIVGLSVSKVVFTMATLVAYVVSLVAIRRALGARWTTTILLGAAGLALEPVVRTLVLGQIGIILMGLVLADLYLMPARFRGVLIGLAAGIKLTPAVFVLYLVLRRDWRGTVLAITTGAATLAVGWLAASGSSHRYWLGGFDKFDRFGDLAFSPVNQSVRSFVSRVAPEAPTGALWIAIAASGVLAFSTAALLGRRGNWASVALSLAGATLLLSPISWTHHWVWVVPALVALVHAGSRITAALIALVFYVAPMWAVPETGPLTAGQLLFAYAYLWVAIGLLVTSAATAVSDLRRSPLSRVGAS